MEDEPEFITDEIECPSCGALIPIVKMDIRIIGRYNCPNCESDVFLIEPKP
jgi:ribosomal protein S27AE